MGARSMGDITAELQKVLSLFIKKYFRHKLACIKHMFIIFVP